MEIICKIIKTLELVEVKGADNMDRLLGSIQALKKLDKAVDEKMEVLQRDDQNEPRQDVHSTVD